MSQVMHGTKPPIITEIGGVTSEHVMASKLGVEVLSMGGNAVDAMVTTSLALAVTQPHLGGLGSDFFALIYMAREGRVYFINASGYAPRGLSKELLAQRGLSSVPQKGPLSIVVPGLLAGLYEVWRRFGTAEWYSLIKPVINLANNGFPAGLSYVTAINTVKEDVINNDGFKSTYPMDARPWDIIKMPKLAKTLDLIAEHGPDIFYRGEIGEAIVSHIQSLGGVLSMDDLREYQPEWSEPLSIDYKGYTIYEMPPNTQGITTLMILKMLEEVGEKPTPFSRNRIEMYLDIYKVAYSIRDEYVGDPRFVDVPIKKMLDINFLMSRGYRPGKPLSSAGDTTYFVVADKEGNVVSAIQSLYQHFGSLVTDPTYGITLNNRASDFSMEGPNALMPRKRPLHTLSTVIVMKDGELKYALGTSGAHFRPQQHTLFITNMVDYGMNPVEAIEAQRFLWDRKSLIIEEGYEVEGLKEQYQVVKYPGRTGVASILAVLQDKRKLLYSDIRGDGIALGT